MSTLTPKLREFKEKLTKLIKSVLQFDIDESQVNEEQVEFAILTIFTIFNNILFNPGEEKRRKFSLKNARIEKLLDCPGALALLKYGGFAKKNGFLELHNFDIKISELQMIVDELHLQLRDDDKVKVKKFEPEEFKDLPQSDEVKRLLEEKKKAEEEQVRLAEEKRIEDQKKKAEERRVAQEKKRQEDAEKKRLEEEAIQAELELEKLKREEKMDLEVKEPEVVLLTAREKKYLADLDKKLLIVCLDNDHNDFVLDVLKTLKTIIQNMNESDDKFRKLKIKSEKIQKLVMTPVGALGVLKFVGFSVVDDFLVIPRGSVTDQFVSLTVNEITSVMENKNKWKEEKVNYVKEKYENLKKQEEAAKREEEKKKKLEKLEKQKLLEMEKKKIEVSKTIKQPEPVKKVDPVPVKQPEKKIEPIVKQPEKKPEPVVKQPEKKPEPLKKPEIKSSGGLTGFFGGLFGSNAHKDDLHK